MPAHGPEAQPSRPACRDGRAGPIGRAAPAARTWAGPGRRISRRPVILAGVAVAALLAGAAATLEVTAPGSPPVRAAAAPLQPVLRGVLHGRFVTAKPGGGYHAVFIQTGQVTAVSNTSVTLRSADGYTRAYPVTAATVVDAQRDAIRLVRPGSSAVVLAIISGRTATAAQIRDLTLLGRDRRAVGHLG